MSTKPQLGVQVVAVAEQRLPLMRRIRGLGYAGALFFIFIATIVALRTLVPNPCAEDNFLCEPNGRLEGWLEQRSTDRAAEETAFVMQGRSLMSVATKPEVQSIFGKDDEVLADATKDLIKTRYQSLMATMLASNPTPREQGAMEARRLTGMLTWASTYAMLVAALVAAIVACVFSAVAAALNNERPHGTRFLLVVGCLAAIGAGLYTSGLLWERPTWFLFPKTTLQQFAEQKLQSSLSLHLAITDGLFFAAAVLILTLIAVRVGKSRASLVDSQAAWLADSRYLISRLALLLMLILIVAIAHSQALLTWPLAQSGGCSATTELEATLAPVCDMVGQIVTAYGVVSTIALGSILLPGIGLLRDRCRALAMEAAPTGAAAWLTTKGLEVSTWDQAGRLIIVLAPLVSGLLVPYLGGIAKLTP